ncbi:MAG: hypothetical protein ABJD97_07885 [Betaproteobacteria bacterium]
MAFTDHCDLYGAVHEDGINRAVRHLMRQRPSLFNYATADVAANRELWCTKIEATPDVAKYGNPLFTIMPPLPLLGADSPPVGIGFCAQLSLAKVDFHPGNAIELPQELGPPLPAQHFALQFRACAAVECPSPQLVDRIPLAGHPPPGVANVPDQKQITLPGRTNCFCFDVYAVGSVSRQLVGGQLALLGKLESMDIVDIKPEALEANIICYVKTAVNVVLREKLTIAWQALVLSFPLLDLATVTLAATGNPPVPFNPAIEEDQVKVFITMTVV